MNKLAPNSISFDCTTQSGHKKQKIACPNCGVKKTWTRYINTDTGEYFPDQYGICDRADKCGHFNPLPGEFYKTGGTRKSIPRSIMEKSLQGWEDNAFFLFLAELFGDAAYGLAEDYKLGSAKIWGGATVFWQLDVWGRVRSGKIMKYGADGRRIKDKQTWAHTLIYPEAFDLEQCFFGEYLLARHTGKPVAMFESEKTAMIFEGYMPGQFVCLACGSNYGMGGKVLNIQKCKPLAGRRVVLFPDASENGRFVEEWGGIAKQLNEQLDCNASVDMLLEEKTTPEQKAKGWDMADLLLFEDRYTIPDHRINTEDIEHPDYMPI